MAIEVSASSPKTAQLSLTQTDQSGCVPVASDPIELPFVETHLFCHCWKFLLALLLIVGFSEGGATYDFLAISFNVERFFGKIHVERLEGIWFDGAPGVYGGVAFLEM